MTDKKQLAKDIDSIAMREKCEKEIEHYQKVINHATQMLRANKSILKNLDKIEDKS